MSGSLREALSAILTHTAALRDADGRNAGRQERSALLDSIDRECKAALRLIGESLQESPAEDAPEARRPESQNKAYLGWLRTRLKLIEEAGEAGQKVEMGKLAEQLRESAESMRYLEIAQAAAAVQRFSQLDGQRSDAAVEILRRAVNRARRVGTDAA